MRVVFCFYVLDSLRLFDAARARWIVCSKNRKTIVGFDIRGALIIVTLTDR
jgi:hypothetical protein